MKNKKQIKCFNIKYHVAEQDDVKDSPYEHRNDLSLDQKCELIKSDLEKEIIIDKETQSNIEEMIVHTISDQTGWLVESFDWTLEEVKQTPTESDNTLDQFMKNDNFVESSNLKGSK